MTAEGEPLDTIEDGKTRHLGLFFNDDWERQDGIISYGHDRHWWVQAEELVGQIYLARYHDKPEQLDRAWQTWEYIRDNIIDHENGEWYWSRRHDAADPAEGTVNRIDDKAEFWKCPYHNSRMCVEAIERLEELRV